MNSHNNYPIPTAKMTNSMMTKVRWTKLRSLQLSRSKRLRKVKRIVGFFRRSERANEELKDLQKTEWGKVEADSLKLIQEVRTRWNSLFLMLDRFLNLCIFVERVLAKVSRERSSKEKPPPIITPEEEEIARREVRDLLRPAYEVTVNICAEKSITISKCIPLIKILRASVKDYEAAHPVTFNLKGRLLVELDKRFGKLEHSPIAAVWPPF